MFFDLSAQDVASGWDVTKYSMCPLFPSHINNSRGITVTAMLSDLCENIKHKMTKQVHFNICPSNTNQSRVLGSPVQTPVLAKAEEALQRNLLPFKMSDVSQLRSAFTKQTFSHQQSNLLSEEGEKQFPLLILLNARLF